MNCERPLPIRSLCNADSTWTLDEEAEDLARQVEAMVPGGPGWFCDGQQPDVLVHLSIDEQQVFIGHLRAGRLRAAIGIVAANAWRCGVRDAPANLASGRIKLVPQSGKLARVEVRPQRIPPSIGAVFCYALDAKVMRADLFKILRKGGVIQKWGMRQPVELPPLSKRDIDALLEMWPFKSDRGNHKRKRE